MSSKFFFALLLAAALLSAAVPSGWKFSTEGGSLSPEGILHLKGEDSTCTYFLSDPCDFQGGHVYQLTFDARSNSGGGGCLISGPVSCNIDESDLQSDWKTFKHIFAFPQGTQDKRLRLGQWHFPGELEFKAIRLSELFPIHNQSNGIQLGEDERLETNNYTFLTTYTGKGHTESRPLLRHTCHFNSNHLVFGPDQEIVYRHDIAGRNLLTAKVTVNLHYHVQGTLFVSASQDNQHWTELGSLNAVDSREFVLPAELFPAKEIFIRLSSVSDHPYDVMNADPGSFQVNLYKFEATIDGTPVEMQGSTQYVELLQQDPRLETSILSLGDLLPGGANAIRLQVKNLTSQAMVLAPEAILSQRGVSNAPTYGAKELLQPNAASEIAIPYELSSSGDWILLANLGPESPYRLMLEFRVSDFFDYTYGALLSTDGTAALWSAESEWKIPLHRPLPVAKGQKLSLFAARNESEAVQLVVTPNHDLTGVNLAVSDLQGPDGAILPSSCLDILRVHYLKVEMKTDSTGILGYWPDPLPPVKANLSLAANVHQPFWLRMNVPADAKEGTYRGSVTLTDDAGWKAVVPVEIRVFGFTLPEEMTCESAFGFDLWNCFRYQKVESAEDKRTVWRSYLDLLSRHHISPYNPTQTYAPSHHLVETAEGQSVEFDWNAWDQEMSEAMDTYHFNTFQLPVEGLGSGTFHSRQEPTFYGYAENTPQYQQLHSSYLRKLQEHLQEKGWLDKAYVYWFDEPDAKDYAFVMNGFKKLKDFAPGVRRMLTEPFYPALEGGPHLWCPHSSALNAKDAAARRAAGEHNWWYVCTGPKAPYATLFIDHPGIEMRVWLWQSWQRQVEGILIWASNYWTSPCAYPDSLQNPYLDPMSWVSGYDTPAGAKIPWGNGDGRLLYPPEAAQDGSQPQTVLDPPVASFRLEMLRDGIDDYEYFVMLKKLLEEKGSTLDPSTRALYQKLLEVPAEVTSDMTLFAANPAALKRHRIKLAEAIERLNR